MRITSLFLSLALTSAAATAVAAGPSNAPAPEMTLIKLAGQTVPVLKGGLYDRYRSNPPLSVVASEVPDLDLSWFKQLHKERADMGFESYSPNFYYKNSRVTAIFTADLDRLKALMPAKVLAAVQPLQVWPGRGLVALTAYTYEHCDNDHYNEIGLSVITNQPGSSNLGPITLLGQSMNKDFWGYVLKLPVNTELARVRGVVGYNLPKWTTDIAYKETERDVVVEVFDAQTKQLDFTLQTRKLGDVSRQESMVNNHFTNVDHEGRLTTGHAVSRQLAWASSSDADAVKLTLTQGSLSTFIESLKLGKMIKYEYVPDFQGALHAPKPL